MPRARQPRKPRKNPAQPASIHELKVTLADSKPSIWRRVAVASDMTLEDLHYVIQIVMGWTNSHLHQFILPKPRLKYTGEPAKSMEELWERVEKRMRQERFISDPAFELKDTEDETRITLADIAPAPKDKFIYEYDFGDGWLHSIRVLKVGPPVDGTSYPICLAGKLAGPPDDCGGVWGYHRMLEVLKNPKHPEYKERIAWLGGQFNPERFELDEVNRALGKMRWR